MQLPTPQVLRPGIAVRTRICSNNRSAREFVRLESSFAAGVVLLEAIRQPGTISDESSMSSALPPRHGQLCSESSTPNVAIDIADPSKKVASPNVS